MVKLVEQHLTYFSEMFQGSTSSNNKRKVTKTNPVVKSKVVGKNVGKRNVSKTSNTLTDEAEDCEEIIETQSMSQLKPGKGNLSKQLGQHANNSKILGGCILLHFLKSSILSTKIVHFLFLNRIIK